MANLTTADVRYAAARAAAAMTELKDELNAADARIGDGDTGSMLARVLNAVGDKAKVESGETVGILLEALARTAASATGSSLGTLLATGLLSMGKATREQHEVPWSALGRLLVEAGAKMSARGGAALGDKTILDGLDAVARAVTDCDDATSVRDRAVASARRALDQFRDQPNRVGRARMFAEATVGMDDPGMLALARLVEAIAVQPERVADA